MQILESFLETINTGLVILILSTRVFDFEMNDLGTKCL